MNQSDRYNLAIQRIDEANRQDPHLVTIQDGSQLPKELLYSQRMSRWLERLYPDASETLGLAVRAQHICRWKRPRSDYPEGRKGYRQWRTDLGQYHADITSHILLDIGYPQEIIAQVASLLRKEELKTNPETQQLEDVACLVFLQYHLEEFVQKFQYDDEKMRSIISKTWKKMSTSGHAAAATIDFPPAIATLVHQALQS